MGDRRCLVLENGQIFCGEGFGAAAESTGEVVFTTGMTGYLETLTDPSYYGQIVIQTFPLIGNYGVIPSDFESPAPRLKGYIVRDWCRHPSNFRSEGDLDSFLKKAGIPGLGGIDTRALTRIIRERGVMNGQITDDPARVDLSALSRYRVEKAISAVSCVGMINRRPDHPKRRVVLWDFGAKRNICEELLARECEVWIVPAGTPAAKVLAFAPDGVMLTNGPGDPADNPDIVREIRKVCGTKTPVFGICMGHQLLALAQGASTVKLKYGHRGANQPVKNLDTGRVYITSQNHGYAVDAAALPKNAVENYQNGNDGSCEGIRYTDIPAFSVQFHPEACGGPLDTRFLFDQFIGLMDEVKEAGR